MSRVLFDQCTSRPTYILSVISRGYLHSITVPMATRMAFIKKQTPDYHSISGDLWIQKPHNEWVTASERRLQPLLG